MNEQPIDLPPVAEQGDPAPAAKTRSPRVRIAALSIAAAVLLTTGAGAGAWAATAAQASGTGTATTSTTGGWGGTSGGRSSGQGFGGQGFGGQGSSGQGFSGQGSAQGGSDSSGESGGTSGAGGSASVDSTAADSTQITGVVTIVSDLGYEDGQSAGTGIVLTASGRVLTNNHVIDGATEIRVTVESTGRTYTARVVGSSASEDVAVLQLQDASGLTPATIASSAAALGDEVTAVGNANGTGTLTAAEGTVTDLDEEITTQAEGTSSGETLEGLIETSADVVSGDSGGPLKDSSGAVVGITTAATSGSADITGYAIPITTALSVAEKILAGQETDGIVIGYPAFLGVSLSSGSGSGAVVAGALEGTPAAEAGIDEGAVITAVDGTAVGSADALTEAIGQHEPGDRVVIAWTDSAGESHSATVTLTEGPAA